MTNEESVDLLETLEDVMNQACYVKDGDDYYIDSMALSGYAYALRLLAKHGRFEIEKEYGRRVIGKWKPIDALKDKE